MTLNDVVTNMITLEQNLVVQLPAPLLQTSKKDARDKDEFNKLALIELLPMDYS